MNLADRGPRVADDRWTPEPLPIDLLLRHDAIVHMSERLAHAGVRLTLPPVRSPR